MLRPCSGDSLRNLRLVGDIHRGKTRAAAELASERLSPFRVGIGKNNVAAGRSQPARGCRAKTGRAAGNEKTAAGYLHRPLLLLLGLDAGAASELGVHRHLAAD